jgi:BrnA antitoxin of type II toxin-antitoxin system
MIGAQRKYSSISYLDREIVEHFKKQATAPRADAYQTQINRVLRAAIEGSIADRQELNYAEFLTMLTKIAVTASGCRLRLNYSA